jgi:hypothetical protein
MTNRLSQHPIGDREMINDIGNSSIELTQLSIVENLKTHKPLPINVKDESVEQNDDIEVVH